MFVVLYNFSSEFDNSEERNRLVTIVPTLEEAIQISSKFFKRMSFDGENELVKDSNSEYSYEVLKKYSDTDQEIDSRIWFEIVPLEKIQEKINFSVDRMYH